MKTTTCKLLGLALTGAALVTAGWLPTTAQAGILFNGAPGTWDDFAHNQLVTYDNTPTDPTSLAIDWGLLNGGDLTMTSGSLTLTTNSSHPFYLGNNNGYGGEASVITLSAGTLTVNSVGMNLSGGDALGTINISGGTFNANVGTKLSIGANPGFNTNGNLNLTGGSFVTDAATIAFQAGNNNSWGVAAGHITFGPGAGFFNATNAAVTFDFGADLPNNHINFLAGSHGQLQVKGWTQSQFEALVAAGQIRINGGVATASQFAFSDVAGTGVYQLAAITITEITTNPASVTTSLNSYGLHSPYGSGWVAEYLLAGESAGFTALNATSIATGAPSEFIVGGANGPYQSGADGDTGHRWATNVGDTATFTLGYVQSLTGIAIWNLDAYNRPAGWNTHGLTLTFWNGATQVGSATSLTLAQAPMNNSADNPGQYFHFAAPVTADTVKLTLDSNYNNDAGVVGLGQVRFTAAPASGQLIWNNAAANATWDAATSANWTTVPTWTNGDDAIFGSVGAGTVTIASGGVTAHSVTFLNTGYTIAGAPLTLSGSATLNAAADATISAVVAGSAGLTKTGTANLTLTSAATYTGATTISAGTLTLDAPALATSSTLTIASGAVLNLPNSGTQQVSTLVLGGTTQPDGVYSSANTGGAITGTGVIRVGGSVLTPEYTAWAATFSGFTDTYPTHDPDGDGVTNQQEFAFGLDPTSGASNNPIVVPLDKATGTFSYTRLIPTSSGLTYKVYTSTNLSTWTLDSGAVQNVTITDVDIETVEVTLSDLPLTAPKLFVRVAAE
jgi:autotransporter-associated beta strand protein